MAKVIELFRIEPMGKSNAELLAKEISKGNCFEPVPAIEIQSLFDVYKVPLKSVESGLYYVYYNYHCSSGHRSVIYVNDHGRIDYKVIPPDDGVLNAFWSEVVVFTLVD